MNFHDIVKYFEAKSTDEFLNKVNSEYKQGKAYRYFTCEFVQEIFYHKISEISEYCVMKTKVTPSQRITQKYCIVWVILTKDKGEIPGGKIMNAYCQCTAGLLGLCNHIGGILFRIEAAVLQGLTHPSCTSTLAKWNVPKVKAKAEATKLMDSTFTKPRYKSKATHNQENSLNAKKDFLAFSPMSEKQIKYVHNGDKVRNDLFNFLGTTINDSCFYELQTCSRPSKTQRKVYTLPKTLHEIAESIIKDPLKDNIDVFIEAMKITNDEINNVAEATKQQSENPEWFKLKIGRITANNAKQCYTLHKTSLKKTDSCVKSIVSQIMHYESFIPTAALKYGLGMEIHAKEKYQSLHTKKHKEFKLKTVGLVIFKDYSFIAASPDSVVNCKCCEEDLLEIKSPYNIRHEKPSVQNLDYLELSHDGKPQLKRNHEYYFQIQTQLGVTERTYCDFFVYTSHGYYLERIKFDKIFWDEILDVLVKFWKKVIGPELLNRNIFLTHFA